MVQSLSWLLLFFLLICGFNVFNFHPHHILVTAAPIVNRNIFSFLSSSNFTTTTTRAPIFDNSTAAAVTTTTTTTTASSNDVNAFAAMSMVSNAESQSKLSDSSSSDATLNYNPVSKISQDYSYDSNANHYLTLEKQNEILDLGQSLSLDITNSLIRPLVFVNNKIAQAASALPALMAANGAAVGSVIATPIQLGALTANNLAAGITGTLVSVPISIASGGAAQMIGAFETGRHFYQSKIVGSGENLWESFQLTSLLRPFAIIGGTNSVLGGIALGTISNGAQRVGQSVSNFGSSLSNAGQTISNFGVGLNDWNSLQMPPLTTELSMVNLTDPNTTTVASVTAATTETDVKNNDVTTTDPEIQTFLTTKASSHLETTNDQQMQMSSALSDFEEETSFQSGHVFEPSFLYIQKKKPQLQMNTIKEDEKTTPPLTETEYVSLATAVKAGTKLSDLEYTLINENENEINETQDEPKSASSKNFDKEIEQLSSSVQYPPNTSKRSFTTNLEPKLNDSSPLLDNEIYTFFVPIFVYTSIMNNNYEQSFVSTLDDALPSIISTTTVPTN